MKIKKWAAVATWRWDIADDDVCGICQIDFDGSCPSCRFPGDECPLREFFRGAHLLNGSILTADSVWKVRPQFSPSQLEALFLRAARPTHEAETDRVNGEL